MPIWITVPNKAVPVGSMGGGGGGAGEARRAHHAHVLTEGEEEDPSRSVTFSTGQRVTNAYLSGAGMPISVCLQVRPG